MSTLSTRRSYLTGTTVALCVAVAGCFGFGSDEEHDHPDYTKWVAESMASDRLTVTRRLPSVELELGGSDEYELFGISIADIDVYLSVDTPLPADGVTNGLSVLEAEFDADELAETLTGDQYGLVADGDVDGYARYVDPDEADEPDGERSVVAVDADAGRILSPRRSEWFDAAREAYEGDRTRLVEADRDFSLVTREAGVSHLTFAHHPGERLDAESIAYTNTFEGDDPSYDLREVYAFDGQTAAENAADEMRSGYDIVEDLEISVEDRIVVLMGHVPDGERPDETGE
ncbi:hypothetical protein [Halovivax gelatinilyticus]|uniref:hypothetical protein n=1 Tax=Halovivax gelatinilyticus TaxID=2961597 RepID=UPI0020CA2A82|nr:hypothetical protein [Halovivax gelatinilyticus]